MTQATSWKGKVGYRQALSCRPHPAAHLGGFGLTTFLLKQGRFINIRGDHQWNLKSAQDAMPSS